MNLYYDDDLRRFMGFAGASHQVWRTQAKALSTELVRFFFIRKGTSGQIPGLVGDVELWVKREHGFTDEEALAGSTSLTWNTETKSYNGFVTFDSDAMREWMDNDDSKIAQLEIVWNTASQEFASVAPLEIEFYNKVKRGGEPVPYLTPDGYVTLKQPDGSLVFQVNGNPIFTLL